MVTYNRLVLLLTFICLGGTLLIATDPEVESSGEGSQQMPVGVIWTIIDQARDMVANGFDTTVVYHAGREIVQRSFEAIPGYDVFIQVVQRSLETCGVDGGSGTMLGTYLQEQFSHAVEETVTLMQANCYTSMVITYGSVVVRYFGRNKNNGGSRPGSILQYSVPKDDVNSTEIVPKVPAGFYVLCSLNKDSTRYSGTVGTALSTMEAGAQLVSPSGSYRLVMQWDSNLVLYKGTNDDKPIWASNTNGYSSVLWAVVYINGDFLLFEAATGKVVWRSGTGCGISCTKDMILTLRDDGVLILWNPNSGTAEFMVP